MVLASPLAKAQDVLDKISQDCCSCLEKEAGDIVDQEKLQMKLGVCMLGAASPYSKELKKKYGVDMGELDRDGERLGELLGLRMATQCPMFLELISRFDDEEEEGAMDVSSGELSGTVKEVRTDQFVTVVVQDDMGRTYEMLVLDHFDHADRVTGGEGVGMSADWSYREREFYDPRTRSYRSYKVITGCSPDR
jgi:hypothetical protein